MRILAPSAALALLPVALAPFAMAADPRQAKPIHMIAPYAAGGVADVQAPP